MDRPHREREEIDEASEAETGTSVAGWWARTKASVLQRMAARVDRAIAVLQRQRLKLAPSDGEGVNDETKKQPKEADTPAMPMPAKRRKPLLMFLLGVLLMLVGIIAGAFFSFSLFAQKIDGQGEFIANQAEEVFEYDKEARRAERALDKSKMEAKEIRQQLEETRTELQQAKSRLAEIEGRAALYGNKRDSLEPPGLGGSTAVATISAHRYRQGQMPNRSCDLGSASVSQDLSRCLNQTR